MGRKRAKKNSESDQGKMKNERERDRQKLKSRQIKSIEKFINCPPHTQTHIQIWKTEQMKSHTHPHRVLRTRKSNRKWKWKEEQSWAAYNPHIHTLTQFDPIQTNSIANLGELTHFHHILNYIDLYCFSPSTSTTTSYQSCTMLLLLLLLNKLATNLNLLFPFFIQLRFV